MDLQVRAGWIFQQPSYLNHEVNLWNLFSFSELQTVMRKRNRDEFFHILQRLRIGTNTKADIVKLRERLLTPQNPNYATLLENSKSANENRLQVILVLKFTA